MFEVTDPLADDTYSKLIAERNRALSDLLSKYEDSLVGPKDWYEAVSSTVVPGLEELLAEFTPAVIQVFDARIRDVDNYMSILTPREWAECIELANTGRLTELKQKIRDTFPDADLRRDIEIACDALYLKTILRDLSAERVDLEQLDALARRALRPGSYTLFGGIFDVYRLNAINKVASSFDFASIDRARGIAQGASMLKVRELLDVLIDFRILTLSNSALATKDRLVAIAFVQSTIPNSVVSGFVLANLDSSVALGAETTNDSRSAEQGGGRTLQEALAELSDVALRATDLKSEVVDEIKSAVASGNPVLWLSRTSDALARFEAEAAEILASARPLLNDDRKKRLDRPYPGLLGLAGAIDEIKSNVTSSAAADLLVFSLEVETIAQAKIFATLSPEAIAVASRLLDADSTRMILQGQTDLNLATRVKNLAEAGRPEDADFLSQSFASSANVAKLIRVAAGIPRDGDRDIERAALDALKNAARSVDIAPEQRTVLQRLYGKERVDSVLTNSPLPLIELRFASREDVAECAETIARADPSVSSEVAKQILTAAQSALAQSQGRPVETSTRGFDLN